MTNSCTKLRLQNCTQTRGVKQTQIAADHQSIRMIKIKKRRFTHRVEGQDEPYQSAGEGRLRLLAEAPSHQTCERHHVRLHYSPALAHDDLER
jgi:hypothetical protein